ncbi:MAG: GNAT family N-acetyltransferase [Pseudohongiella sp.]|nr:GNAT family N-acetyltransferase [Pseudohongiella sp.]
MSTSLQIEYLKASETDVDQLIELRIRQLVDEGYQEVVDIRKDLKQYFSESFESGSLICWVGIANDAIVATAGICFYQLPPTFSNPSGRIAYITNMYTDDAYRRRGVASHLLNLLIGKAKSLNFASVRLHASTHGKGIYEKAGFTDTDGYMGMRL